MKRTTLKHIKTLACYNQVDLTKALHERDRWWFPKDGLLHSLSDCIWDYCDGWRDNYYFDGVADAAMTYHGDACLQALRERGLDTSYLDEASERYDEEIAELFRDDVTRAYADAAFDADATEFYRRVLDRVTDFLDAVDAPYYCLLACDGKVYREVSDVCEATDVVFGFTRRWHQGYIAGLNDYNASRPVGHYLRDVRYTCNPECIDADAEAHIEDAQRAEIGDIQECASCEDVVAHFVDYSEAMVAIRQAMDQEEKQAREDAEHWAWVARVTQRLMTNGENNHA